MDWQQLAVDPLSALPVLWGAFVSGALTGAFVVLVTLIYRARR